MHRASTNFTDFASRGTETRERQLRIAAGVAISLAVHALLLSSYRGRPMPAGPDDAASAPHTIAVWLRPPPPAPRAGEPVAETARPGSAAAARHPRPRNQRSVIALPAAPAAPATPGALVVQPDPQDRQDAVQPAPRFDLEAARRRARQIASEPDPEKAGTALERLPAQAIETETRAARAIAGTHRRDCKDGLPGGLLGPLIILLDKKDSGCKW